MSKSDLAMLREQLQRNEESLRNLYGDNPVMKALRSSYEWNNERLKKEIAALEATP